MINSLPASRQIIALSGKPYAGKDQVADLIIAEKPHFVKTPIAKTFKKLYAKQNNLTLEDLEKNKADHRPGLAKLADWGRAQSDDYWLRESLNRPESLVISDMRTQSEYDFLKKLGAKLVRVDASKDVRAQRGKIAHENLHTETELDAIPPSGWDAIITNNSTLDNLKQQIKQFLQNL